MNKIKTLDGLRFIFCISIFLNHCGFMKHQEATDKIFEGIFHNGAFGVMFFILLSGFCMELGYGDKFEFISRNGYWEFLKKRMARIYPLYVFTMLYVFIYQICTGAPVLKHGIKFIVSLTMLQTLTLRWWNIFNSAAWFISCLFVIYLLVPFLFHFFNRITSIKRMCAVAVGCYFIVILYEIVINVCVQQGIMPQMVGDIMTYSFPLYRIWHFVLGVLVAKIFKFYRAKEINISRKVGTIMEVGIVGLVLVIYALGLNRNAFDISWIPLLYVPVLLVLIYVMAWEKGVLSKVISSRFFVLGGTYSMEIYLLHYVVIWFGGDALYSYFFGRSVIAIICEIFVLFGITLLLAMTTKCRKS